MHTHETEKWQHSHEFLVNNNKAEKRTQYVLILTGLTMIAEIVAGSVFGSMALLADGWHMGTHVAAFLITIYAYRYARKHADSSSYAFGTGKVGVLGGYASAVVMAIVALMMMVESLQRIITPETIQFNAAIGVAVLGLIINIISAIILKDDHSHSHHVDQKNDSVHHQDHNLHAAYMHVLADALTSLLAIIALVLGKYLGWNWLDPVMGVVGAIIITRWSYGLLKQTSPILLDGSIDDTYQLAITEIIEADSDNKITDIHIWKVSADHYAAIISLATHFPRSAEYYKELLIDFSKLSHITIEVYNCGDCTNDK